MKAMILIAALLFPMLAHAEFVDGNMLRRMLKGDDEAKAQALGYVVGVHDAKRGKNGHCSPAVMNPVELTAEVEVMLEEVGELRSLSADVLVTAMLMMKYPCAEKEPASVRPGSRKPGLNA